MDETSRKPQDPRDTAAITPKILAAEDPPPFFVHRPEGASDFFLTCDHGGNLIPRKLGTLGLEPLHLVRHIAWDVGAAGLSRRLAELLDATVVTQTYSRLVIDCNRQITHHDSIAARSEDTDIPGNLNLPAGEAEARAREIFKPYQGAIAKALDARAAAGRPSVLVAMHSFAPVYHGQSRPWHIGLLYNRDRRLATILKALMAEDPTLCIGDNQPFAVGDDSDYGIPVHGEQRDIPHVEIEMRHDLIESVVAQAAWAKRLADWLTRALERLREGAAGND